MINTALLPADKDPMGAAIADYFKRHKADRLRVFSSQFDEDEIPVEELFRTEKQMPLLERTALQMATGKILDVGAGSGCHSLALQEAGKEVHAIDISPLSVEVMKQRGVRSVSQTNLFNEQFADEYDTILMLMTGAGIGLAVLFRANRNWKKNLLILLLLYGIGSISGLIIHLFV